MRKITLKKIQNDKILKKIRSKIIESFKQDFNKSLNQNDLRKTKKLYEHLLRFIALDKKNSNRKILKIFIDKLTISYIMNHLDNVLKGYTNLLFNYAYLSYVKTTNKSKIIRKNTITTINLKKKSSFKKKKIDNLITLVNEITRMSYFKIC